MSIIRFCRNLLFALFAVYYAQGFLYKPGSIISKTCLFIILAISAIFLVRTLIIKKKCLFYNIWTLLLFLNIFGFIFTADFSNTLHTSMFKNILGCMLPFYPFYYFAKNKILKSTHLIIFFCVMLPVIIIQYFLFRNYIILEENQSGSTDIVNNIAYVFVGLIPFVFLIKRNKLISGIIMALLMSFIIGGSKRGAIISGAMGLLMYFYYQVKTIKSSNFIRGRIVAFILIISLSLIAYKAYISNEFAINRMYALTEGNSSHRDEIYTAIWNKWYNIDNIWNFLFGFGFAASIDISGGTYAHNDWLELLSNFGLLGICIYFSLFFASLRITMKSEWASDKKILTITNFLIWFIITLFSMRYSNFEAYPQVIMFAYLIGSSESSLE